MFGKKQEVPWPFTPKPMVSWFAPGTLWNAAVRAVLTSTIGQYGDRRDFQATLGSNEAYPVGNESGIWIDFVADTGDGFESTFAVARVMAEEALELDSIPTERASLILFGGDQVYPDAHDNAYRDRFIGPYNAAFRNSHKRTEAFAVPGNHDWYDGLVDFMSLFCGSSDRRAFENIRTPQQRSYWAIKLPHNWVCLGLDWHIGVNMDLSQREYFESVVRAIQTPSKFILVVPNPVWVQFFQGKHAEYYRLRGFIDNILDSGKHTVELILSGDLHCYARYELHDKQRRISRQLVMAGGGGAYLYPTHGLPRVGRSEINPKALPISDNPESSDHRESVAVKTVYPPPDVTEKRAWNALLLPRLNPALAFLLIGPLYLLLNYIFRTVDEDPAATNEWAVWCYAAFDWPTMKLSLFRFWDSLYSLSGLLTATFVVIAVATWAHSSNAVHDGSWKFRGGIAAVTGAAHGVAHLILACVAVWLIAATRNALDDISVTALLFLDVVFLLVIVAVAYHYFGGKPLTYGLALLQILVIGGLLYIHVGDVQDPHFKAQARIPLLSQQVIFLGGMLGTLLLGIYLRMANLMGGHSNDVLACQSISGYKNFVRMHIDGEGQLDIYPIGVENPPKLDDWKIVDGKYELRKGTVRGLAKSIDAGIEPLGEPGRPH